MDYISISPLTADEVRELSGSACKSARCMPMTCQSRAKPDGPAPSRPARCDLIRGQLLRSFQRRPFMIYLLKIVGSLPIGTFVSKANFPAI
jgi:hypothetical protein